MPNNGFTDVPDRLDLPEKACSSWGNLIDLYLEQLVKSKAIIGHDDPVACDDGWRVTVKIARPPGLIEIRFGIKAGDTE